MKLSCLPVSLFSLFSANELDIGQWAAKAREIGFDGFDISTLFIKSHTPTYLDEVKRKIAGAGMPLVMVTTYPDFTHPDPRQREREDAYIDCDMAVSAELGAKYLRVLAGQAHPGTGRDAGVRLAVAGLRRAAAAAEKYGITLVYENHAKPGAWHYIDFSYPADVFLDVYEGIKDTSIRINFDIGNATSIATHPHAEAELLMKVIDRVETLHVCDMAERGKFSPTLVGTGKTPVVELLSLVKRHGFDGWLCIEEAGNQGLAGVQMAHDYVRSAWEKA